MREVFLPQLDAQLLCVSGVNKTRPDWYEFSMSGGDFSFSFSLPAQPGKTSRAPRYIARPFEAHPVGDETLILASGSETSVRAPVFYARMLAHCDHFQTLDQHTESVIGDFGLPAEQR
ncbi:MAG TPA: hypothetical protein VKO38_05300, partial [Wenzhouxiangella sp.]|nr:hypothetical protein [Wenzhouxiangella sp.]